MGALSAAGGFSTAAGTSARLRPFFARAAVGRLVELARSCGDKRDARVLSLDARTGILVGQLARAGTSCWAVDPEPTLALRLYRSLPQVAVSCTEMSALAVQTASFDLVCVGGLGEQPETQPDFAETRRVLHPGAVFAQVFNLVDLSLIWMQDLAELIELDRNLRLSELQVSLSAAGFSESNMELFANPLRTSVDLEFERLRDTAQLLAIDEAQEAALLSAAKELLFAQADSAGAVERSQQTVLRYWRAV